MPPWRRRNLVHYSPIGRVTQMCSVFLSGLLGVWDWMDLVSLCKIPQGIFPLGNRTSVGSCGCGVYGYLSRPSLVLPGRMGFSALVVVVSYGKPSSLRLRRLGVLRGFRGCWGGARPEPASGRREVFYANRGLNWVPWLGSITANHHPPTLSPILV